MSEPKLLLTKFNRDGGRSEIEIDLSPCPLFGLDANGNAQFQKELGTLGLAGPLTVNFGDGPMQKLSINQDIAVNSTNRASGAKTCVFITNTDVTAWSVNVSSAWKWVGAYQPTVSAFVLASSGSALIELWCFGTEEADVVARWSPVATVV